MKRNSKVLDIQNDDKLLRMAALLHKDGSVSVAIVNRAKEKRQINLSLNFKHAEDLPAFRAYEYDSRNAPTNEFGDLQEYSACIPAENGSLEYTLLPESLTVFTTDYKTRDCALFSDNVVREKDVLCGADFLRWNPVKDPEHCYYRVFRGETEDFVPSPENQIASTVDTTLDFNARYLDDAAIFHVPGEYYKVLSVDRSGNGIPRD
jgi:hypothetical protein